MADSDVLERTKESELDVLQQLDDDDKDTITFSASNSHELLVDVNEVGFSSVSVECSAWHLRNYEVIISICVCVCVCCAECDSVCPICHWEFFTHFAVT